MITDTKKLVIMLERMIFDLTYGKNLLFTQLGVST